MNILINNNYDCHYEIVESILNKLNFIIKTDVSGCNIYIYVKKYNNKINHNSFVKYMEEKYPKLIFLFLQVDICKVQFDYTITCSCYENHMEKAYKNSKTHFYICHDVTPENVIYDNMYHLTPLCGTDRYFYCDILPYAEVKKTYNLPIYIVQGNFERRSLKLLLSILKRKYTYNFIIKLLNNNEMSAELKRYSNNVFHFKGLTFQDYHTHFIGAYCILPLACKQEQPDYYNSKLTSSINYALGYKTKILIDKDLQNIYKMNEKDAYVFNNYDDVADAFAKSLDDFYAQKK
jgi:hypothetical protein